MRRRVFIGLVGGAAWPLAAHAQHADVPVIGFLSGGSETSVRQLTAFRQGLGETGYVEGQNVAIEYRWARNQQDGLRALANDLVDRRVGVIVTGGGSRSGLAAKAATNSVPIVVVTGDDLVRLGLVTSLNRPGANVTGVSLITTSLEPKRLELLRELAPTVTVVGLLVNLNFPDAEVAMKDVPAVARAMGQQIVIVTASTESEIESAFATLVNRRAGALLVASDPFFFRQREQFVALAARHAVPTIYWAREYVEIGGLISYGASLADTYRQAGVYAGRILRGAKPTDLPVMQPTRFELVINLKTAKALGLTVPPTLLATADEMIE